MMRIPISKIITSFVIQDHHEHNLAESEEKMKIIQRNRKKYTLHILEASYDCRENDEICMKL